MIDPKFFNFVAQMSHILLGSTLVFGVVALFHIGILNILLPIYTVSTGIKEFWYDQNYEDPATRGSNLLDFSCYQLGAYAALGACLLIKHTINC